MDSAVARDGDELAVLGSARISRTLRALMIAIAIANIVYLGALLLPGDPASTVVNLWLPLVALWLPVGVFWLVAVQTRFTRAEVVLAAAGITCNSAGETIYILSMDSSGYLASPSFADLGYLLFYPLLLAALVVLVRRQSSTSRHSVVLDTTLAALGSAAVLAVILAPVFSDATAGSTPLNGVIAALYPLFDLLLVAVIVGISASPVLRIGPRWQFLVAGLLLFTAADIAFALLNHSGTYSSGTPLDAAWSAAVACGAVWVLGVGGARPAPPVAPSIARAVPVPAVAVLAGLAVLLTATQTTVPAVALVLAAATVALSAVSVMLRQAALARMLEGQDRVVERLTELDKSKSDMIGQVSHEMRTPLTSILGFLELVLDDEGDPLPAAAKDMVRVADRNARRLHTLVNNMMLMTGLESSGSTTITEPVDISRVLGVCAETLCPIADSRDVQLTVVGADATIIEGDEAQLERVFTNLIENAVKFTPPGGSVDVQVAPDLSTAAMPSLRITVADTGIGIPENEVSQLFTRFFRASNAREKVVPGTGLGLAMVRDIVRAHQGDVSVTSVLGEGTAFHVTLPLRQGARS